MSPGLGVVFATGETHLPEGSPAGAVLLRKPYDEVALKTAVEAADVKRAKT